MRVFFAGGGTGGHLYPALAIARALVRVRPVVQPHFIGAERGIERHVLPNAEFPYTLLDLHPLYRSAPWRNLTTLRALLRGLGAMDDLADRGAPRLVVATGGYASSAALAFAWRRKVPYVLQEANAFPGATIRLFARHAQEIYLGFGEAATRFPLSVRQRAFDVGCPIDPPPTQRPTRASARARWLQDPHVERLVLVVGGSQGSATLNRLVAAWLDGGVPRDMGIVWGTGRQHYETFASYDSARVKVVPYLSPIADAYAAADLAICRAGAMTTAELCAWGIPMFLVPLPTAAADHQTANAKALQAAGAAQWAAEGKVTPNDFSTFVLAMADPNQLESARRSALVHARPASATDIATRIARLLA